jgi:hypothetical protein
LRLDRGVVPERSRRVRVALRPIEAERVAERRGARLRGRIVLQIRFQRRRVIAGECVATLIELGREIAVAGLNAADLRVRGILRVLVRKNIEDSDCCLLLG